MFDRNQISPAHRYKGMIVTVQNPITERAQTWWLPTDNLTNTGWELCDNSVILVPTWAAGKNYVLSQLIINDDVLYICKTAHTSSADFANDTANWIAVGGVCEPPVSDYAQGADFKERYFARFGSALYLVLKNFKSDSVKATLVESLAADIAAGNLTAVSGDSPTYTHLQIAESIVWNVTHNLNTLHPTVTVFDDGGNLIVVDIQINTADIATITFPMAIAGVAVFRK